MICGDTFRRDESEMIETTKEDFLFLDGMFSFL